MGFESALTLALDNGGGEKPNLTVVSVPIVVGSLASWIAMLETRGIVFFVWMLRFWTIGDGQFGRPFSRV